MELGVRERTTLMMESNHEDRLPNRLCTMNKINARQELLVSCMILVELAVTLYRCIEARKTRSRPEVYVAGIVQRFVETIGAVLTT